MALLACGLLVACSGTPSRPVPPSEQITDWKLGPIAEGPHGEGAAMSWRTVAEAEIILRGRLTIPEDSMAMIQARRDDEAPMTLAVSEVLKGEAPAELGLKYYPSKRQESLTGKIFALRDADILIGVIRSTYPSDPSYYLAGEDAIDRWTAEAGEATRREVEAQAAQAARVARLLQTSTAPHSIPVNQLIEFFLVPKDPPEVVPHLLLDPSTPGRVSVAFDYGPPIFSFDQSAIPAIVARMDDSRRLQIHSVSVVVTDPNWFEGLSHYSPDAVVDFMAVLLDALALESFGFLHNGGTEAQRQRTVQAWRVWVGRSLNL